MRTPSKQYARNGVAGLVQRMVRRQTGAVVGVYRADQAGIDGGGVLWVCVCETHSRVCGFETLTQAMGHAPIPAEWCEGCSDILTLRERTG